MSPRSTRYRAGQAAINAASSRRRGPAIEALRHGFLAARPAVSAELRCVSLPGAPARDCGLSGSAANKPAARKRRGWPLWISIPMVL